MKHIKTLSRRPRRAQDDDNGADLNFFIATLQFGLDILTALQTKKLSEQQ